MSVSREQRRGDCPNSSRKPGLLYLPPAVILQYRRDATLFIFFDDQQTSEIPRARSYKSWSPHLFPIIYKVSFPSRFSRPPLKPTSQKTSHLAPVMAFNTPSLGDSPTPPSNDTSFGSSSSASPLFSTPITIEPLVIDTLARDLKLEVPFPANLHAFSKVCYQSSYNILK